MGADGYFNGGAAVGVAAAGGEGLAAGATEALLGRQLGGRGGGGETRVLAAAVAGAAALLAAATPWRRGSGRVMVATGVVALGRAVAAGRVVALGRGVGQGVGVVVALAAAAVEALFEQAHLGLEVGEALAQLGLALLDACRRGGLRCGRGVGEEFFELGLALAGAEVEGLVVADLLPGVPKDLLAGRQAARGCGRDGVEGVRLHSSE
jgi:hypothetical protein